MRTVHVSIGNAYDVVIDRGGLARTGEWLAGLTKARMAALIADDTVDALYGNKVAKSLESAGFRVERMAFPHGEHSKTVATYAQMLDFLAERSITRTDIVVALGGGVTGDMAGFAAATYQRGMAVAQIPTTLLAMVDSSVGGKTGVDLPAGKNLAGAFHQPIGVLCDPQVLDTLPPEVFADGASEAIKYGVLCDEQLFDTLATGAYRDELEAVIERCIAIKAEVCAGDERDHGQRQLLNLGHTLGHAIERVSHYAVAHGHAVAIGMVYATRIAISLGRCNEEVLPRLLQTLANNALPTSTVYDVETLAQAAQNDKKRAGETLAFVLPRKIGECELYPVPVSELAQLIGRALDGNV